MGAQVAWAHQTFLDHEFEVKIRKMGYSTRRLMSLWLTSVALKRRAVSLKDLQEHFRVPLPLAKMMLQELVKCHTLHESKREYIPAPNTLKMKFSDVLQSLELRGEKDFPFIEEKARVHFEKTLESFREAC